MFLRLKHLCIVGPLTFALAACSDSTAPFDGNFDSVESEAALATVQGAFDTEAFESFAALGKSFTLGGPAPAASAQILQMAARPATRYSAAAIQEASLSLASMARAVLIPAEYRGLKLVYDETTGGYVVDEGATDAPALGVRFQLYAVDPVTGEIALPLNPTGHVDLIDESTELVAAVRLTVVSGDVTYLDYTVSMSGPPTSPTATIQGMATDGENTAEFTLSHSIEATFAGWEIDVNYDIQVNDWSIVVALNVTGSGDSEGAASIDIAISHRGHSVTISGTTAARAGQLEVRADGELFATITLTETSITVVDAGGEPLTEREIRVLEKIMDTVEDILDNTFDDLFDPVEFLFGVA